MSEECSEAAPSGGSGGSHHARPLDHHPPMWLQPPLWDANYVVITARLIVDGPGGGLTASVECTDFWTGERIACEVLPSLVDATHRLVALAWIEQLMLSYAEAVAPF